jgi:predicted RNase H-like HicB family nuclease
MDSGIIYLTFDRRGIIMEAKYILSDYVEQAMMQAIYDKFEDETFSGRIPDCRGVIAFGITLRECEDNLRSTLEDWILLGLKLGHPLPIVAGIDLNKEPTLETVDAM